jgi:hypothetical protein
MELENSRATQEPSRIVIADDHPLFRCAIRHTLESHSDFEVVGEAANGREALEFCRRAQGPDLRSLYISRTGIKLRSGACAAPREHANRGMAGVHGALHYERYGLPDMGVYISRLEGRNMRLSLHGRREPAPRLQRRLRRL